MLVKSLHNYSPHTPILILCTHMHTITLDNFLYFPPLDFPMVKIRVSGRKGGREGDGLGPAGGEDGENKETPSYPITNIYNFSLSNPFSSVASLSSKLAGYSNNIIDKHYPQRPQTVPFLCLLSVSPLPGKNTTVSHPKLFKLAIQCNSIQPHCSC